MWVLTIRGHRKIYWRTTPSVLPMMVEEEKVQEKLAA
ncbi:hypothetical protein TcasGA2_TC033915 [Tribolium castaneum]|uniref:Uncharacterized protein n=1 Tax=Tribolium castaneum TaxID=7070 RepID=A0A139WDI6_TRICA|nr:hypothetical protein TcasGA2_TC033915 [Tribolium castaneum]